jgi:hypothetical protein
MQATEGMMIAAIGEAITTIIGDAITTITGEATMTVTEMIEKFRQFPKLAQDGS